MLIVYNVFVGDRSHGRGQASFSGAGWGLGGWLGLGAGAAPGRVPGPGRLKCAFYSVNCKKKKKAKKKGGKKGAKMAPKRCCPDWPSGPDWSRM